MMDRHINHKKLNKMKFVLPFYSRFLSFAEQFDNVPLTLTNRQDPLEVLPNEIIRRIFSYFDLWQFPKFEQVSKRWFEYFADDSALWVQRIKAHINVEYIRNRSATEICLRSRSWGGDTEGVACVKLLNKRRFERIFGNATLLQLCINIFNQDLRFFKEIAVPKQLKVDDSSVNRCWRLADIFRSLPVTVEVFTFRGSAVKSGYCPRVSQSIALKSLQMYLYQMPNDLLVNCLRSCPNLVYLRLSFSSMSPEGSDIKSFNKLFCQSKLQSFSFGSVDQDSFYENYATLSPRNIVGNSICDNIPGNINSGWPPQLTSFTIDINSWEDYITADGSLQQLRCFQFRRSYQTSEVLEEFHIGKNLKLLKFDLDPYENNCTIWERCPNLRYLSVNGYSLDHSSSSVRNYGPRARFIYDNVISSLSGYCPKIKIIELEKIRVAHAVLRDLAARENLKTIAFVYGSPPDLSLPNVTMVSGRVIRDLSWA